MSRSNLSIARQLDAVCDEYEEQWTANHPSVFDDFLNRVNEANRAQLLNLLLELDVELRINAGQEVSASDYDKYGPLSTRFLG